jgi:phosphoglycolate phosphatase
MVRAVIFDLDGVLVDSRPGVVACVNRVLEEQGFATCDPADLERIIGPPLQLGFATLLAERGGDPSLVATCVVRYRELYESGWRGGGTLLQNGIVALLGALEGRAILAVATSKPLRFAEPILASLGIRDAFRTVTGPTAETDGESKTATLARALAGLPEVESARTWMVGDRSHDMYAARANGVVPIGVTWGFGTESELWEAGASAVGHDCSELIETFERTLATA